MTRSILFSGAASFVMAFAGILFALWIALPRVSEAQPAKIQSEEISVIGNNGTEQVRLSTWGQGGGVIQALSADGRIRTQMATGGANVPAPQSAGFNVFFANGG